MIGKDIVGSCCPIKGSGEGSGRAALTIKGHLVQ